MPVYAGTGSNSTAEAVELTREAEAAGADGFLVVAPYYNKPSQEGLFRHFSKIAEVTEKPIILYSIPGRCGIEISVDVTARLYEKYPHVCCMKAAEGSCEKVIDYVRTLGPDYAVMSGDDGLTLPFMSAGATGVISVASNLVVAPLVKMVADANAGKYGHAQASWHYPLFKALFIEPNPVPIKYALKRAGIIQSDEVRLPLARSPSPPRPCSTHFSPSSVSYHSPRIVSSSNFSLPTSHFQLLSRASRRKRYASKNSSQRFPRPYGRLSSMWPKPMTRSYTPPATQATIQPLRLPNGRHHRLQLP